MVNDKKMNRVKKMGIDNILNEQRTFYDKLFGSEGISYVHANNLLSNLDLKINEDYSNLIEKEISVDEIEKCIKDFKNGKSPGFDGIPAEWYKTFWYLIKYDFMEVVNEICQCFCLSDSQYYGLISLLYKSGDRENLKNWRPITLLNLDYKLIAKCLANRVKPILPSIIHLNQKGYIKDRNINESNRFLQDLIDFTDLENNDGAIIFFDQTKAFDRVEWEWIELCLKEFGFKENFRG